jgi:hypothetical protein
MTENQVILQSRKKHVTYGQNIVRIGVPFLTKLFCYAFFAEQLVMAAKLMLNF